MGFDADFIFADGKRRRDLIAGFVCHDILRDAGRLIRDLDFGARNGRRVKTARQVTTRPKSRFGG